MSADRETMTYEHEDLKRDLKSRHIQMIAIGGAIGTGLFYGSSWAIKTAGPAIILVYLIAALATEIFKLVVASTIKFQAAFFCW